MPNAVIQPTPDFTWDPATRPPIAGLRPYRNVTYRLEAETSGTKFIVHNYGHGGAGITMSWGCAHEVVDLVTSHGFAPAQPVAVLGAGVMGLTAATLLAGLGLKVTIYAKAFPPDTTSNIAGGQWAPSLVNHNNSVQFTRILRRAFTTHSSKIGLGFGVSKRLNYSPQRSATFESAPSDVIPPPQAFRHLPFAHFTAPGYAYATLLIEPPILLPKLLADLAAAQAPCVAREFANAADVLSLSEDIIVNCTGLGAGKLFNDRLMIPVRGQLVMLPAQPGLQYLFSGHGYLFPRQDAVVVGGTDEPNVTDPTPNLAMCKTLLAYVKNEFQAAALRAKAAPIPDWFIRGK